MKVEIGQVEKEIWKPKRLSITFENQREYRIFKKMVDSTSYVAEAVESTGSWTKDQIQDVLDIIGREMRKE